MSACEFTAGSAWASRCATSRAVGSLGWTPGRVTSIAVRVAHAIGERDPGDGIGLGMHGRSGLDGDPHPGRDGHPDGGRVGQPGPVVRARAERVGVAEQHLGHRIDLDGAGERMGHAVGEGDLGPPVERMAVRHRDDQPVGEQRPGRQPAQIDAVGRDPDLGATGGDVGDDPPAGAHHHGHVHVGLGPQEPGQDPGQDGGRDRADGLQHHRRPGPLGELGAQPLVPGEHVPGVRGQQPPARGRGGAAPVPQQQRRSRVGLERADPGARRGQRQVREGGGAGDRTVVDDVEEQPQVVEVEGHDAHFRLPGIRRHTFEHGYSRIAVHQRTIRT